LAVCAVALPVLADDAPLARGSIRRFLSFRSSLPPYTIFFFCQLRLPRTQIACALRVCQAATAAERFSARCSARSRARTPSLAALFIASTRLGLPTRDRAHAF